jgi:hypothetical protein
MYPHQRDHNAQARQCQPHRGNDEGPVRKCVLDFICSVSRLKHRSFSRLCPPAGFSFGGRGAEGGVIGESPLPACQYAEILQCL